MAQHFTEAEWQQIETHLNAALAVDPKAYGLPERRDGSVVLMSWNIRKFGALTDRDGPKKSPGAMRMIERIAAHADLLSIQEQQEKTGALEALVTALGPDYDVIYSDVTGRSPGYRGMSERFAFLYRHDHVRLGHLASDLSYDRTAIAANMNEALKASFDTSVPGEDDPGYLERLMAWVQNTTQMVGAQFSTFVQFIRSPHLVEFVIEGPEGRYEIYAINAHLVSGKKRERQQEFFALLEWLLHDSRKTVSERGKIIMIMGDLNMDFDTSNDRRRIGIENYVTSINAKRKLDAKVNFPFLDGNFNTNARRTQTYDHIAWLADDTRLPRGRHNDLAGTLGSDQFDYGMFDFTQLFVEAGPGRMPDGTPDYARFAHDLSDHLPIWVRLPLPAADQRRFTTT
ncbi:hypothetical protein [Aliiroseovarius sediminis]|uniref:hypothetical protein n=1 Tax=Aliiroseovarius sediminis TaxID=2925839 RepID=UPI001F55DBFF|nr:hypothetical protein [Aliiroseovarius sediminis]MCI2393469.1 hypothetical protein [Aliiroseovarius sediminis]